MASKKNLRDTIIKKGDIIISHREIKVEEEKPHIYHREFTVVDIQNEKNSLKQISFLEHEEKSNNIATLTKDELINGGYYMDED